MKVVLALILVVSSMVTCEEATSKDEGKDKFATKKEVEEQRKTDLAKLRQELQEQFQKKLNEEIAKVKVANSNLRKADRDLLRAEVELRRADKEEEAENAALRKQSKRQADVVIETKKLIRAEINSEETKQIIDRRINSQATKEIIDGRISTYLNTHSVCQMGSSSFYQGQGMVSRTITFPRKFSKKPQIQAALSVFRWDYIKAGMTIHAEVTVQGATTTSMKITLGSVSGGGYRYVYATWIACI